MFCEFLHIYFVKIHETWGCLKGRERMKKIIILVSVLLMGLALAACGNDTGKSGKFGKGGKVGNEEVRINGKIYDLSEDCDEIIQEFVDDMYVVNCPFEEGEPIRKQETVETYDEEQGIYVSEEITYQLDKNGEYVETDVEDLDERIMMRLWVTCNTEEYKLEEVYAFEIASHELNAPDFEIMTPNGIGIGSTVEELEDAGADKVSDLLGGIAENTYEMKYLDGELIDYSDYSEDVERIQKLDPYEWIQEWESDCRYSCLPNGYKDREFRDMEDKELMAKCLAEADVRAQLVTGEKDTLLTFRYEVSDGKVTDIKFNVAKQSKSDVDAYERWEAGECY